MSERQQTGIRTLAEVFQSLPDGKKEFLLGYNITLLGIDFVGPILVVGTRGEDLCDLEDIAYHLDQIIRHTEMKIELRIAP